MTDADRIVERYVDGVLERNPQVATVVGDHEHDDAVPEADGDAVREEIAAARETLEALDGADGWTARVARSALRYDVHEMTEVERWRMDPDAADGIASLIYPLYVREFAPLPDRLASIASRLEGCPAYVEDVMARIDDPVAPWVERERGAVEELPRLLRLLADEAGDLERQDVSYRLNAAVGDVLEVLEEYDDWLADLDGRDDWRLDGDLFDRLLELRGLPASDLVRDVADDRLDRATAALRGAVDDLGVDDPREAAAVVEEDHPSSADGVVDAYVEAAGDHRDAVRREEVAPLPEHGGVSVAETPEHLRPLIPETGYVGPAVEAPDEAPRYHVTPPAGEDGLRRHNHARVASAAARDLFPGHHLQRCHEAATGRRFPAVAGQFTAYGDDLVEGWCLHAERRLLAVVDADAGVRLEAARGRVEAACRARADVGLHTGEMSVREAASFLADEAGMDRDAAAAEARGMTRAPGYHLSATVGAALLDDLLEDARAAGMTERELHGTVLEGGRAPVALHRERVLDGA